MQELARRHGVSRAHPIARLSFDMEVLTPKKPATRKRQRYLLDVRAIMGDVRIS